MRSFSSTLLKLFADRVALVAAPSSGSRRISDEHPRVIRRPSAEVASRLHAQLPAKPAELSASDLKAQPGLPISLIRPAPAKTSGVEKADDNWDSDFEEGISISKIAGVFARLLAGNASRTDWPVDSQRSTVSLGTRARRKTKTGIRTPSALRHLHSTRPRCDQHRWRRSWRTTRIS